MRKRSLVVPRLQKATTLKPQLDQGCEQNYYRMVSKATDSLVNVYLDSLNQNNR